MPDGPAVEWSLVALSAALATRDDAAIEEALRAASAGADPAAIDEVVLQAHLFVGFPTTLRAMELWSRLRAGPPAEWPGEDPGAWESRGAEVCARVYGGSYDRLRARVASLHPDLDRWMVAGGYGRVIGRPGVELRVRELCIAALLAVWDAPQQLHSHLRGALHAGAGPDEVERALEIAGAHLGEGARERVAELWEGVRERYGERAARGADTGGVRIRNEDG